MPAMVTGQLTKTEMKIANYLGTCRNKVCLSQGRKSTPFNGGEEILLENNIKAVAGELFVARVLNVYPDLKYEYSEHETMPRFDLVCHGHKIDVKWREDRGDYALLPDTNIGKGVSAFVFVTGALPQTRICGWCAPSEILRPDKLDICPNTEPGTYATLLVELNPIEEIEWHLRRFIK